MPVYEYECAHCGASFELLRKVDAKPPRRCPECGESGGVSKKISAPAFQFKGSGWYVTDYAAKGGAKKEAGDEKPASESADSKKADAKEKGAKEPKGGAKETKESKKSPGDSKASKD